MFRDDYKKELDKLTLSDEFRNQTVQLMEQQAEAGKTASLPGNAVRFRPRFLKKTAAAAVIMLLSSSVATGVYFTGRLPASTTDCAAPETENEAVKSEEFDSVAQTSPAADFEKIPVIYTINDAEFVSSAPGMQAESKERAITYNTANAGGMGYEAYNCYNPVDLEHNPAYTVGDEFETLPVYKFTPVSPDDALQHAEDILESIGIDLPDVKITWSKPIYWEDGQHCTNEDAVTADTTPPGAEYNMNYIDGEITNTAGDSGEFSLWATNGKMRISFDSNLSDIDKTARIIDAAKRKYSGLFDYENCEIYSWHDRTYKGEMNRYIYAYRTSDDYGENLFNATLNNTSISQVKHYEEDILPTNTFFWVSLPYYTRAADLPAITYRQALGYLFSGQFYSSYTNTIDPDAQIVHIEMAYLPPEYNMEIPGYEGYSVPFYKFYVQTPDVERTTLGGIMKEYHVYYVCAIHPSYIQLDEDYYRFN